MLKRKGIWIVALAAGIGIIGISSFLLLFSNKNKNTLIVKKDWSVQVNNYGIPSIKGNSQLDAIKAMGYVNAKDRLIQMDYFRRFITGKLSEIYGIKTLKSDLEMIKYEFEATARSVAQKLNKDDLDRLKAYSEGVNLFIDEGKLPYEFEIFKYKPEYWNPESCILVSIYMHYVLNYRNFQDELMLTALKNCMPEQLYHFYTPDMDRYSKITLFGDKGRRCVDEFPDSQIRELYQKASVIKSTKENQLKSLMNGSYPLEVVFEAEKSLREFRKSYINKELVVDFNCNGKKVRVAFTIDEELSKKLEEMDESTKEIHIEGDLPTYLKDLFPGDPNKFSVRAVLDLNIETFQGKGCIKVETTKYYVMDQFKLNNLPYGSNCWIIGKDKSKDGKPIIANDPHLPFMFPNIFYLLSMEYGDNFVKGFMIPGMPFITSGNSKNLSWGITSTASDFMDFVIVDKNKSESYEEKEATINVNIAKWKKINEKVTIRKTKYGPLLEDKLLGNNVSIKWTASDPLVYDFSLAKLESAANTEEAVKIVQNAGCAPVNILIGDEQGNIAWTLAGKIPKRKGISGDFAEQWNSSDKFWNGYIEAEQKPLILNPKEGFIVNANDQVFGNEYPYVVGNDFANGWRTKRISDLINSKAKLDENDMRNIQLDTLCGPYDYYYELIQSAVASLDEKGKRDLKCVLSLLDDWDTRADKNNQAMLVVNYFRNKLIDKTLLPLYFVAGESSPFFKYDWYKVDEMVISLWYDEKFYNREAADFYRIQDRNGFFVSVLYQIKNDLMKLSDNKNIDIEKLTWGDLNTFKPIMGVLRFTGSNVFMKYHKNIKLPEVRLSGSFSAVNAAFVDGGPQFRSVIGLNQPRDMLVNQLGGDYGSLFEDNSYNQLNQAWGRGDEIKVHF